MLLNHTVRVLEVLFFEQLPFDDEVLNDRPVVLSVMLSKLNTIALPPHEIDKVEKRDQIHSAKQICLEKQRFKQVDKTLDFVDLVQDMGRCHHKLRQLLNTHKFNAI